MASGPKANLLIVDNEPSIRRAFSEIFTEFGYSVRAAEDGFTALVAIGQEIPDILLSDLNMPGISGFELLSIVRTEFSAIQVIAMSGDFSGVDIPPGVCANAFYEKGSGLGYLLQIVESMACQKGPSSLQTPSTQAPAWIPRNGRDFSDAYITLSCPECLRSSQKISTRPSVLRIQKAASIATVLIRCAIFQPGDWRRPTLFGQGARCMNTHAIESPTNLNL